MENKETLEEAAERAVKSGLFKDETLFISGAKWQAERMYSEGYKIMTFLDDEYKLGISDKLTIERLKWYFETYFEQFIKK
jgi:hypothetical protein